MREMIAGMTNGIRHESDPVLILVPAISMYASYSWDSLHSLIETQIDPCLQNVSHGDEQTINNDMLTTILRSRALRLPYRYSGAESSNSETSNESADNELWKSKTAALQYFSDERQNRCQKNSLASS